MSTYGDKVLNQIAESERVIRDLTINGYNQDQIKGVISQIAASVELHLKRDVFPNKSVKDNFSSFIDELNPHFSDGSVVANLHAIRLLYNRVKHDPHVNIDLSEVKGVVSALLESLSKVHALSIGQISAPIRHAATRIFWICAWDHLIHGETEVTIFLPSNYDGFLGARSIDIIHINALDWANFKDDLKNFGRILPYEDWISPAQIDFWLSQGDCLTPLVFEGEYKAILVCASNYRSNKTGRLAGLDRTDTSQFLFQSCVLAAIDHLDNLDDMSFKVDDMVDTVISDYAVNITERDRVKNFIKEIANLIDQVPVHHRLAITGPYWTTPEEMELLEKYSDNKEIHSAIDKQNRFILGVRML
uniref:hypothetical protein n=1 Tax=Cellvibrio fontiphilus TaxID=1815559 RepID=UPI002B4BDFEF|nr:hypothetical protein [Cellvibrio fontiphilus]